MYTVYSKADCPQCDMAKRLLESRGLEYKVLMLGTDFSREELLEGFQRDYGVLPRMMPQVIFNGTYVGSFNELKMKVSSES